MNRQASQAARKIWGSIQRRLQRRLLVSPQCDSIDACDGLEHKGLA